MSKLILHIALISSVIISSCSSPKVAVQKNHRASSDIISEDTRMKLDRLFIEANKAKLLEEYQKASSLFSECIKIDPNMHASMYELAKIYMQTGQVQPGLLFAKQAAELDPGNKWYQILYAESLAINGDYKEAGKTYEKLVQTHPNEYEFYIDWAYMLIKTNNYNEALKVYDQLENLMGLNERIVMQKQLIYLKENKIQKAAAELQRLIELNPGKIRYLQMLGQLYQANGLKNEAEQTYMRMLEVDPEHPRTYLAVAEYYELEGDHKKYYKYLKKAFENPKVNIDHKIREHAKYFKYFQDLQEDPVKQKEAFELADILIELHLDESKAFAIYGDLLDQLDSSELARAMYLKALVLDNSIYNIWHNLVRIEYSKQDFESMLKHANEMKELFPNQIYTYLYHGIANARLEKYQKAIESFEKALIIDSDNNKLIADIYANLGDSYHGLNDHPKSDSCYNESLKLEPNNSNVLNNYSYYLSLREESLMKAKKMAKKANELKPGNSAFEDTYGWVLYKLEDYKGARILMEKSLANGGSERAVILEHYGDVLYMLGEHDKAVEYWQKARDKDSESELHHIDIKIREKRLYE